MFYLLCQGVPLAGAAEHGETVLVLSGQLTGADHETYREVPFQVPDGVKRITVSVTYERDNRTVVDLGIFDPDRFRGWSGGNKARFSLAETHATPSYLPGPLPAGEWTLILGVPNIRSDSVASFRAEVLLESNLSADWQGFASAPLKPEAGWYRGELHTHTAHSDGSCMLQSGDRGPCPVYRTVEAAAAQDLDFVAVTEHNTVSHHQSLHELQLAFDETVLMSGREITTFYGHANIYGITDFIDFRARDNQINPILEEASNKGAFISINHPGLPSGEICMGCGWTADTDFSLVDAVEVVNGSVIDSGGGVLKSALSGIPFWETLLNDGYRMTAIAGSDNHDAEQSADSGRQTRIGAITTVVFAQTLSQIDLLAGLRQGRAFIDLEGTSDRLLDLQAASGANVAMMGDTVPAGRGENVTVAVTASQIPGASIALYHNGTPIATSDQVISSDHQMTATVTVAATGEPEWFRAEVISAEGRVLLLSNPVYVNNPR
ncbi:MAG: phosphotransferase [Gammaproteobacteria bacterium]|nr:phosphotransferase [Gammaproteobacteria bacterium]